MFGLPESTDVQQQLSKKQFFIKSGLSGSDRTRFDNYVHKMTIVSEISQKTVNVPPGETIKSFFVVEMELKNKLFDKRCIELVFKLIQQNLVLILRNGKECAPIIFKETMLVGNWVDYSSFVLPFSGLNLDKVWENIVLSIGDIMIEGDNTLEEQITIDMKRQVIEGKIAILDKKMRAEIQPRQQREYYAQIKQLRDDLKNLN